MSDPDHLSREDLIEARAKIRREIEILISPSSVGGSAPDRAVLAELQAELTEIERRLANP